MITTTYQVEGMTCGHCVSAVTSELMALGAESVTVELFADGASAVTVENSARVSEEQVVAALEQAGGYRLVGPSDS